MTFLFWNLNGKPLQNLIADLLEEHNEPGEQCSTEGLFVDRLRSTLRGEQVRKLINGLLVQSNAVQPPQEPASSSP